MKLKNIFLTVLTLFCAPILFAEEYKILESSSKKLIVEYSPIFYEVKKQFIANKDYEFHNFKNSSSSDVLKKGSPDLRYRSLLIQIPSTKKHKVSILQSEPESFTNVSIIPVPELKLNSESLKLEKVFIEKSPTEKTNYNLAELFTIGNVQGTNLGELKIFPMEYDPNSRILKKYKKIVVQIDFDSDAAEFIPSQIESGLILNKQIGKINNSNKFSSSIQSPFSQGKIYKIEITEDAVYKIDFNYLISIGVDALNISSIYDLKIYGADGRTIEKRVGNLTNYQFPQMAIEYIDNNLNSKFDTDDYILFYAKGVSGWNYNSIKKTFSHYLNPYSNSNYVFLQIFSSQLKIKKMEGLSTQVSVDGQITSTIGKFYFDEEKTNLTQSGLEWYSTPMIDNSTRILSNKLHGYINGTPITYSYDLLSRADKDAQISLVDNSTLIKTISISGMSNSELNGDPIGDYARREIGTTSAIPILTDERSNLKINYSVGSAIGIGYINWIEILYKQQLTAVNENLFFTSPDTNANVEFLLNGFTSNKINIYDVSDYKNVKKISNVQLQQLQGNFTFKDILSSGNVKTYWAGSSVSYKTPALGKLIPNSNLTGNFNGADFIIFSPAEFLTEANRLKIHKELLPQSDKLKTIVVDIDTLLNEFGFGLTDPTAIRNYILFAQQNWEIKPRYVLFFGDGNYDFRNILKSDKNWIPTFQTDNSNTQISSFNYDDFFVMLDSINVNTLTISHGRITARSFAEAKLNIDKIINYETKPVLDQWKNLITISADDRNINNNIDGADNEEQAERLAREYVPGLYEIKKIYIGDYPTVISSAGRRKPDARAELLKQINLGTLVLNYTGHGNPKVWAHENILTKEDVKTEFKNGNRLPLIIAATCDWARFDEVGESSSAEEVIINSFGGAIGVISATRAVFSGDNAALNYTLYNNLFSLNPFAKAPRIGDALMLTKNNSSSGSLENNLKYHLLGDPTLRLAVPKYIISVDSLNGKKFSANSKDTLRALGKIKISASVKDEQNNILNNLTGVANLSVFDSERNKTLSDLGINFTFVESGAIIFRGEHTISGGRMNAQFIVPKDISYENKNGRISIYFSTQNSDGRGFTNDVIIGGTSTNIISDKIGPTISIYFDKENFQSGDLVNENPTLIVELKDSSGINSTGSGIGHRLEAWLDNNVQSIDLTNYYKSSRDNFQKGEILYQLENLEMGKHTIKVKAWDVYNNSSEKSVDFYVTSSSELNLSQVYNFPNPATTSTKFTFLHNQLIPIDVEITIYTVAGRRIRKIELSSLADKFVSFDFDCRDEDGDELANGIYIYKITASTFDNQLSSEATGKLVIMR